jgi:hypothetical protein
MAFELFYITICLNLIYFLILILLNNFFTVLEILPETSFFSIALLLLFLISCAVSAFRLKILLAGLKQIILLLLFKYLVILIFK